MRLAIKARYDIFEAALVGVQQSDTVANLNRMKQAADDIDRLFTASMEKGPSTKMTLAAYTDTQSQTAPVLAENGRFWIHAFDTMGLVGCKIGYQVRTSIREIDRQSTIFLITYNDLEYNSEIP
ncbi:MAG: hypothetical protein M1837_000729 [Sclerophora amabilis]|nr:MAG: hypothetical protein M1837_000729 [Sclerophora amabilis]